jgi:hypothetical protein
MGPSMIVDGDSAPVFVLHRGTDEFRWGRR